MEHVVESTISVDALKARLREMSEKINKLQREKHHVTLTLRKLNSDSRVLASKIQMMITKNLGTTWTNYVKKDYPWTRKVQQILEDTFGLVEFRECQLAAINAVVSKSDVIVLMPTGGGKSLCYQLPAILLPGITLVISPLISLIEDQVHHLTALNIKAAKLAQGLDTAQRNEIFGSIDGSRPQSFHIVYCTPEFLANSKKLMMCLQKCYDSKRLTLIAIDEVHCISEWGHDFRKDYLNLGLLRQLFENVPIIGLTATATVKVVENAISSLNIPNAIVMKRSFFRKNLFYRVDWKPESMDACISKLRSYLQEFVGEDGKPQSGIFYTSTIKDANEIAQELRKQGIAVNRYHGDLPKEERTKIYNKWLTGKYQVVVATIAFGLGIDKPDVRFVVHISIPKSLQGLYQESGRAGRDGKPATCILWYKLEDYLKIASNAHSKIEQENSRGILQYCLENSKCRHAILCRQFDEGLSDCKVSCDNCKNEPLPKKYCIKRAADEIRNVFVSDKKETRFTFRKLIQAWSKISKHQTVQQISEFIIAHLIFNNFLKPYFNYTPYATNVYLKLSGQDETESMFQITMKENREMDRILIAPVKGNGNKRKLVTKESPTKPKRKVIVISSSEESD